MASMQRLARHPLYGTSADLKRRLLAQIAAARTPADLSEASADLRRWVTDEDQVKDDLVWAVAGRLRWDCGAQAYEAPRGLVVSVPVAPDQTLPVTLSALWRHPSGAEAALQFRLLFVSRPASLRELTRAFYSVDD